LKTRLLYFLLIIPFAANAQQYDSLNWRHKPHNHLREHFLFIGGNVNYLTVISLNSSYTFAPPNVMDNGESHETITNIHSGLPGFQINFISYHKISSCLSYFNGEGFIYYHNKLDYGFYHTSDEQPGGGQNAYESDTTITYLNSQALFIHYILGLRFNLPCNIYINTAVEPHLLLLSNRQPEEYSQSWYDSVGHVSSTHDSSANISSIISAFNVNVIIGIGYRLLASHPHPICIEFNFTPSIFNNNSLFSPNNIGEMTLRRSAFELNIGLKL
jgi:hypothetical protein